MMRVLLATEYYTTTQYFDDSYYVDNRQEQPTGPSVVLIVGLTMAFIGAAILIIVICCVCRKRQPPESQGAVYERAATTDGQSTVTAYPLGLVQTSAPSMQANTVKTASVATSQMSNTGNMGPPMQQPGLMYGHPGQQQPYPGYPPPSAANMGPPYIYPVPPPTQPMTTLAVFGAPDGAPADSGPPNHSAAPLPYPLYPPSQDAVRSQHMAPQHCVQEYSRQVPQQYSTQPYPSSELPRQATAPPPPQM